MRNIILLIGVILLATNILLGIIISAYPPTNVMTNNFVIIATTILLFLLWSMKIRDGFRIPLSFLFAGCGIVELILGQNAPEDMQNNWFLAVVVVMIALEAIALSIAKTVSDKVK